MTSRIKSYKHTDMELKHYAKFQGKVRMFIRNSKQIN